MLRFDPLLSRAVRKLRGQLPLDKASVRVVEVFPPMRAAAPRAPIFLDSDLDRVTATDPMSTFEVQRALLVGTTEFPGSYAYQLPPVPFIDGNFARGRLRFEASDERERLVVRSNELVEIRNAALVSSSYGNKFFGHFLLDDLPTAELGGSFGVPFFVEPPTSPFGQANEYRSALALEHPTVWSGHAVNCWVFRDPHLNDSKVDRLRTLRTRVARSLPEVGTGSRLYLTRNHAATARGPENELELQRMLEAEGWSVLDPSVTPVSTLHRALAAADVVAGVEGSQMSHAIYAVPEGRKVALLMPPDRFNLWLKDFLDRLDIRLGFHVGHHTSTGWSVDVAAVARLVEQLHAS